MQSYLGMPLLLTLSLFWTGAHSDEALDEQLQLLQRHGIASDTESILSFLRRQRPGATVQREVDELIKQLSSAKFTDRELPTAKLDLPLGRKRLDLSAGRNSLHETFSRQARSLAKGYGSLLYEADNAGGASVVDGKLLIDGDNDEGDQRVYIMSDRMVGRAQWPRRFEVRARLGGKEGNNFAWHVGVSIGRVKVLFHPGLSGGDFRAECTDTHEYIFGNEGMGFTPATDAAHEMLIKVIKNGDGAGFKITVRDSNSDSEFNRRFTVSNVQLGKFNRIGLERSGRRGASALFDSLSIQLKR